MPDGTSIVSLTGNLDVRVAQDLQKKLLSVVNEAQKLVIDCSAIESIDIAAIQLLLGLRRDVPELAITLPTHPEAFKWFSYSGALNRFSIHSDDSKVNS